MTMSNPHSTLPALPAGPDSLAPQAYMVDGVMGGRIMAWIVDVLIVAMLTLFTYTMLSILGFITFGLAWMLIPIAAVGTLLSYAAITIGGSRQATYGMRMAGLRVERVAGGKPDALGAAVHALLFYVAAGTIALWCLTVTIGLLRPDRRMGHDLLTGLVVVRG
jgi:uncharacterized RDD family membrane protein YckC